MHIHDFHSKLTSMQDEGHLFAALRSLSLVEDLKSTLGEDEETVSWEWVAWPPMGVSGSCAAAV